MNPKPGYVDPRGVRFGGYLTGTLALAAAALANAWAGTALALVLLLAASGGNRWNAWAYLYRATLRRRLGPPRHLEPEAAPRFAQLLGGVFAIAGVAFLLAGPLLVGQALLGVVSALAYVNGVADFCLGCKFYGLLVRLRRTTVARPG